MQDISMGEMIIEYSGTLIRPGLCDIREKYYDSKVCCIMYHVVF